MHGPSSWTGVIGRAPHLIVNSNGTQPDLLEQIRRLALGSNPRLVDRGRVLNRPERLLHVLAAAAAAVAAAAATSISHHVCLSCVSEAVLVISTCT